MDGLGQVAVRGRDDADVDRHRLCATDAVDDALLDRAQQLRLQSHVHFRDFVEQQRAAGRFLELADAPRDRAGEGTFLVAEQFGFEEMLRDRRAVDADEGLPGAVRARMDIARQHLLAGAAFAGDEDRRLGARDLLGELNDFRHRIVLPDHLAGVVGDGGEHGRDQLRIGRQRDVFLGAGMDRGDGGAGVGGDAAGDDRHVDVLGLHPHHEVADVETDIDQQEVGALAAAQDRAAPVRCPRRG